MTRRYQLICCLCHHPMAVEKPVYLLCDTTNEIRGPLHARCAQKLHDAKDRELNWQELRTDHFGHVVPNYEQLPLPIGDQADDGGKKP